MSSISLNLSKNLTLETQNLRRDTSFPTVIAGLSKTALKTSTNEPTSPTQKPPFYCKPRNLLKWWLWQLLYPGPCFGWIKVFLSKLNIYILFALLLDRLASSHFSDQEKPGHSHQCSKVIASLLAWRIPTGPWDQGLIRTVPILCILARGVMVALFV